MGELVSPELSEKLVLVFSVLLTLWGGITGWRSLGLKGLWLAVVGPLALGMWRVHVYLTRYDPQTQTLGLDQVKVVLLEFLMFVALGVALGWIWARQDAFSSKRTEERDTHNG